MGQGQGDGGYDSGESPLEVLQDCIQGLPRVIAALPDPKDVQDATKAMVLLTGIQVRLMGQGGNGQSPSGR